MSTTSNRGFSGGEPFSQPAARSGGSVLPGRSGSVGYVPAGSAAAVSGAGGVPRG